MGRVDRLDGWKAIAAHFGRDRTTVIRWARERGLPVRQVPGGKTRTVFAFRSELDAWARTDPEGASPSAPPHVDPSHEIPPAAARRSPSRRVLLGAGAVASIAAATVGVAAWRARETPGDAAALPADAAVAALYLRGRDHWGQRSASGLARAVADLEAVTRASPGFAPAHAALADAYILSREFGSLSDTVAFARARHAAERARALAPRLASAHRALGFVAYWHEHDSASAGRSFRRAVALDPEDAQTRFWYGNILADNGEFAAALRELNAARLAEPGSVAIETDLAWAEWSAGRTAEAVARLEGVLARRPDFAVAHECLSLVRLSDGDYDGYLRGLRARQQARADPDLARRFAAFESAYAVGGGPALNRAMLEQALADEAGAPFPNHAYAAFLASLAGDRAALLEVLRRADRGGETWGSAGYVARIARRWATDAEIATLLRRRAGPRVEPG